MSRKTRKLMWSAPLVAVLAIAGALTMFMTAAPNGAQADHVDLPDQVTGLDATATSRTSVRITWNAPASDDIAGNAIGGAPTGYRIDHSEDNRVWEYLVENTGNADTSFVDTAGISPNTVRHYRVFAINEAGTGPVSGDPVTAFVDVKRTHPPVAPSRVTLTATAVSATQINLSWTAPADDGGVKITGYDLVHMVPGASANAPAMPCTAANNPDGCELYAPDWKTRAYEHEDLNPSTAYCYRVTAKNGTGSSVSDVVCAVTHDVTNPDPPGAPVAVIVDGDPTHKVLLYWLEPDSNGGYDLAFPEVEAQARTRNEKTVPYSPWSKWVAVKPGPTLGDDLIEDVPGGRRGVGGMRLPVKPSTPDGTANTQVLRVGGSDDTTQEVQYRFRIRSKHANIPGVTGDGDDLGQNRRSGWVEFNRGIPVQWPVPTIRDGDDPPPPPADVTAKAIDGATTRDGQGIRVTWTDNPMGPKPSDYRIDRAKDEGSKPLKWKAAQVDTVTLEQWEDLGLKAGDTWHYRVFPINGDLYGEAKKNKAAVERAIVSGAHALLNLRQDSATYDSVTMCWNSLPAAADYAVYHTALDDSDGGPNVNNDAWTMMPKTGDALDGTCYTHEEMAPGAKLWFRVVALDDAKMPLRGTSGAQAIGTALSAGEPVAPLGLVAEVAADSSFKQATDRGVLLLWNEAASPDGNVSTVSYTVQRMVNGGAWETIVHDTDSKATHYNDTEEPKAGEQRAYRVAGLSGMDERGVWSNVAYIPAQVIVHDTALGAPTNVMAMVDDSDPGSTSVTVTWTNGVNADRHIAVLFDANWEFHPSHIGTAQTDGMVTFENVQPGAYTAVVLSIEDNNQGNAVNFEYDIASVTVGAGN